MNWILCGAISGGISVAAGAFGAHALSSRLEPAMLNAFDVAVRYQMYHALALIAVGLMLPRFSGVGISGWCFLIGTVLFSGSLYALSLSGLKFFGPVTPLGGLCLIVGWASMAYSVAGNA